MRIFIFIICIFNINQIQAKCATGGFTVFPKNKQLYQNSCLLIEGYGNALNVVKSLTNEFPVYLESEDNHKVKLSLIDYNKGALRINQVLLQPSVELISGLSYTLKINNLENAESIPYALLPDQQPIYWNINPHNNNPPPKLLSAPKLINTDTTYYGCGPSITAEVEFITDSDSTVLVKTELVDLTDDTTHTYFLKTSNKDTLTVGHGMCSGAFKFNVEHRYQVRFSIMDNCNSFEDDWSDWIEFDSPYEGFNSQLKTKVK